MRFKRFLASKHTEYPFDFLLMQEAEIDVRRRCVLERFGYEAAANLRYAHRYYGVVNASTVAPYETQTLLSKHKEFWVATHKSALISTYRLADGKMLHLVNVHAINFRESGAYRREKARLSSLLEALEGTIVMAGDFNTWNKRRLDLLTETVERLGMRAVSFEQAQKRIFGYPIDFVFYRDATLLEAQIWHDHGISDHHPLYARFEIV